MREDGTQRDSLQKDIETESGGYGAVFGGALDAVRSDGHAFGASDSTDFGISGLVRWRDILKQYTQRTLTLSTDRLPAISGVAMRFSRLLGDEYCCRSVEVGFELGTLVDCRYQSNAGAKTSELSRTFVVVGRHQWTGHFSPSRTLGFR